MAGLRRRASLAFLLALSALALVPGCDREQDPAAAADLDAWPSGDLAGAFVQRADTLLVLAAKGQIHRSEDGGASWLRTRVPPVRGLAALSMANATTGWAVGHGVILSTSDGGHVWERQRLPGRAASLDLVAIHAIDGERALALERGGRVLRYSVEGGGWQIVHGGAAGGTVSGGPSAQISDQAPGVVPGLVGGGSLRCDHDPDPTCYAAGQGVFVSHDLGDSWSAVEVVDPAGLASFVFRLGRVDLSVPDRARLTEAVDRLRTSDIAWSVEAFVTAQEIERYAEDRDPSALFDLVDARLVEVIGAFEMLGVDSSFVEVLGAPPWEYEEHLDDDPDFLDRYLRGRLADRPSAVVSARERWSFADLALSPDGKGLVAIGSSEHILGRGPKAPGLERVPAPSRHDLLSVAVCEAGFVVVGRQGEITLRRGGFEASSAWAPVLAGDPPFFDTLRSVASGPSGRVLLAVGDAGRMLMSEDGGRTWRALSRPTQGLSDSIR